MQNHISFFIVLIMGIASSLIPLSCRHSKPETQKGSKLLLANGDLMHVRCDVTAGLRFYDYSEGAAELGLVQKRDYPTLSAGTNLEVVNLNPSPGKSCLTSSQYIIVKTLGETSAQGAVCLELLSTGQTNCGDNPPVIVGGDAPQPTNHNGIKGYHFLQGAPADLLNAPHSSQLHTSGAWALVDNYEHVNTSYIQHLKFTKNYNVAARLDYKSHESVPLASHSDQMQTYINMAKAAKDAGAQHIILGNELNLDGLYDGNPYSECKHTQWPGTSTSIKEDENKKLERLEFHLSLASACSPKNYAIVYDAVARQLSGAILYVAGVSPSQQTTNFNSKSEIVRTDFEVRWAQGDYWLYQTIMEIKALRGACPSGVALHAYGNLDDAEGGALANDLKSQIRALVASGCANTQTIVSEYHDADFYKENPIGLVQYIHRVFNFFKKYGIDGSMWFAYGDWHGNGHKNAAANSNLQNAINSYGK